MTMERVDTHLCLVSDQAVPNLLPILDLTWRPRRVVLAVSPAMKTHADWLTGVIKRRCQGVAVEQLVLDDAYDYSGLANRFLQFLAEQREGVTVALNVTGGTKVMAVAAQEVFRADDRPVVYVNAATDEVVHVGSDGRTKPLTADLRVRDLLESHGYMIEDLQQPQITAVDRDLCARLIDHVKTDGIGLGMLNWLAATDDARNRGYLELTERERDSQSLGRVISLFEDAGRLRQVGARLTFADEGSRKFVNGGWLETHVYQVLQNLRGEKTGITDVVMGVSIMHPDRKTRNELDVACQVRNTLHIVECKTANLASERQGRDDKATEAIYKMEALLKVGGLRTRAMIADYRGAMSREPANMARAKAAGILVASGDQLRDLAGLIRSQWLGRVAR